MILPGPEARGEQHYFIRDSLPLSRIRFLVARIAAANRVAAASEGAKPWRKETEEGKRRLEESDTIRSGGGGGEGVVDLGCHGVGESLSPSAAPIGGSIYPCYVKLRGSVSLDSSHDGT